MRVIRQSLPWPARAGVLVFFGGIGIAEITLNTRDYAAGRASGLVFFAVIPWFLLMMALAYRIATLSFRADPSGLVIHNLFRTRRVPISQIVGFDVGARIQYGRSAVRVITPVGIIRIDAYKSRGYLFRRGLYEIADSLEAWLEDARAQLQA